MLAGGSGAGLGHSFLTSAELWLPCSLCLASLSPVHPCLVNQESGLARWTSAPPTPGSMLTQHLLCVWSAVHLIYSPNNPCKSQSRFTSEHTGQLNRDFGVIWP